MRRAGRVRQQGFASSRRGPRMFAFGDLPVFAALTAALVLSPSAPAPQAPQRHELVQLRTENSRTYQNANGTRTTVTSLEAMNYRGADGKLRPISTKLVPHGRDSVINEAGAFRVAFDKRIGEDFVRLDNDGARLEMTLEDAQPAAATVSGSKLHYRGVERNTALEYEALARGVKETIVLEGPSRRWTGCRSAISSLFWTRVSQSRRSFPSR